MRSSAAAMALAAAMAVCVSGCGERGDPTPAASDPPAATPIRTTAPSAAPTEAASPAPGAAPPEAPKPTATATSPAATSPAVSAIPVRLRALGTEPFWNAQISGEMLTYTSPDDQKGRHAELVRRDRAGGAEFSGKLGGSALHIAVTKRACSDGMSDRSYPFTVVLTLGSERRQGCAS